MNTTEEIFQLRPQLGPVVDDAKSFGRQIHGLGLSTLVMDGVHVRIAVVAFTILLLPSHYAGIMFVVIRPVHLELGS